MADQNNISDLEKEYEAKINAVVANEAYKASIEESPDSNASLGGTVDISNLLTASKTLSKITESVKNLKDEAGTSKKSGITYGIDYSDIPMARLSRKDRKESESFLDKYKDEIQAVHSKRQQNTLEQFLNTGSSGLLYKAESMLAESSRKQKFKEQMQLFDYNYKNREKGNIRKYQEQLKANGGGVNFTLPNTNLRNLLGNSSAATRIKNENINNERKKDFYIQKQAREIVDEIYKTIQEKRQRESNPISAQSASRLLLTGDAGKYKIAQERFVSGNYMTEAAKHFQFLRQDARNGNRTQDSLEKGLKDSFESKFDSIKEKVTSFFSSGIGRIKDILSGVPQSVKNGASKFSQTRFARYQAVNWGRFANSTKRNSSTWKDSANENLYTNNGGLSGFVKNLGVNSITTILKSFGLSKLVPFLGIGAELFKKAAQKLYDAGVEGLKAFGEIQAIQTNLGVVYGNQSEADQMFEKLSSYAVKSPFSTRQIANFAVLLKQSGVYSSDIENTLKMLGDTAGGNEEKMSRIANNYAQIVAMGKATSMDLRQFANANIPIYEELKKQLGNISQKELRQITAKGGITSDIIEKAFIDMTSEGGRFANATEKGAKTFKARKTNLEDIRQLGMAEFGKSVYNIAPVQPLMNLQERWYSGLGRISKSQNNFIASGKVKSNKRDLDILLKIFDAVKKQTEITNENTRELAAFNKNINSSYGAVIDEARSLGTQKYTGKVQPLQDKRERAEYALSILKNLTESEVSDFKKSETFRNLLKSVGLNTPGLMRRDAIIEYLSQYIERADKRIQAAQENKKGIKEDYSYYLQSQGIAFTRNAAEMFGKFSKKKESSTSIDADIYEMYKSTKAYQLEEEKKRQEGLTKAKDLLNQQQKLGINENGFNWIKNNQGLGLFDIAKAVSLFYGNTQLDISSENMTGDTRGKILDNLNNLAPLLEGSFSGKNKKKIESLNKKLRVQLEKTPNGLAQEKNINEKIDEIIGSYHEFSNTITDESQRILLNALFIDPEAALLKSSQIKSIEKTMEASYTSFWKRFTSGVLDVSIEGFSKIGFEKMYKDKLNRNLNQSISLAMMQSGSTPAQALSYSVLKSDISTGKDGDKTQGIDQQLTAQKYSEYALSSKSSSIVTNAYVNQLKSTISELEQFFSGAIFRREDLDKLYDETFSEKFGYKSKEEFVNAFSGVIDASGKFKENILKSADAIMTETKARLENASVLAGLKTQNKSVQDKINKTQTVFDLKNVRYDPSMFSSYMELPIETRKNTINEAIEAISNIYSNEDIAVGRAKKDITAYVTGSALKAETAPELKEAKESLDDAVKSFNLINEAFRNSAASVENEELSPGSATSIGMDYLIASEAYFDSLKTFNTEFEKATGIDIEVYRQIKELFEKFGEMANLDMKNQLLGAGDWQKTQLLTAMNFDWWRGTAIYPGNTLRQQRILDDYEIPSGTSYSSYIKAKYVNSENEAGILSTTDENSKQYENLSKLKEQLEGMGNSGRELSAALDFSNIDISALEKADETISTASLGAAKIKESLKSIANTMRETATSNLSQGLSKTWSELGESLAGSDKSSKNIAKAWKDVAKNILSSIGAAMTQAGLNLIIDGATSHSKGEIAAGFALAAAGGVAGIMSGLAGYEDKDNDNNDYDKKIKNLKDALSDLIDQAKTDAEYYQKNLLHKQALSENDYYSAKSISVNDAIITPNGNVISTAPDDYLIATKTPDTLVGNNIQKDSGTMQIEFNPTFNFIDQTTQGVQTDVKESYDENGNVSFDIVLKNVVGEAIANGDLDASFNAREYRLRGKSVAW